MEYIGKIIDKVVFEIIDENNNYCKHPKISKPFEYQRFSSKKEY